jgi:hypothetical protein
MTEEEGESMRGELGRIWDIDEENKVETWLIQMQTKISMVQFWIRQTKIK